MSSTSIDVPTAGETAGTVDLRHAELGARIPWHLRGVSPGVRIGLLDATMLVAAGTFATISFHDPPATLPLWAAVFGVLVLSLLSTRGQYRPRLAPRLLDTTRTIATATALASAIVISARTFTGESTLVAAQSVRLWAFATVLLVGARVSLALTERRAYCAGAAGAPTLIVGAGRVGHLVASRLRARPDIGLRPVGFLDKEPLGSGDGEGAVALPVLGASWDLDRVLAEHGIQHVIVTFSTAPSDVLVRIIDRCERLGVRTSFVPRMFEKTTEEITVDCLGGLPLVSTYAANPRGWRFGLKYGIDRIVAAVAVVVLSPLLGALALAVLLSSGRPILYRQERVGVDGKRFGMLKFRSMRPSRETESTAVALAPGTAPGGVEGVDRRTPLGTFMRRTSLDELPQLLNVVKGDMTFVGPRPERPEFVEVFERTIHRYGDRHRVRSGITGWAQVNGLRGKTSLTDRAEWDNFYIENWSLWFDFKIMLLTFLAVLRPANAE